MFKALNDLCIIIYELRQWQPSSEVMKATFSTTIIMNTCASKLKIVTIDNSVRNLQELQKPTFRRCHASLSINSYLSFAPSTSGTSVIC
jgi:hypothetical protein